MKSVYRIYPSIGIARIGNSENDFFIGPEAPGVVPDGPYRSAGKIKPQGARFRVYEFERDDFGNETCKREVVAGKGIKITWKVHLVNRKAAGGIFPPGGDAAPRRNQGYDRAGLVIDSKEQAVSGINKARASLTGDITFKKGRSVEGTAQVELGSLQTDDQGRLIVIGGPGTSASPIGRGFTGFANNDGWYDSVSDGPIKASIQIGKGKVVEAEPAWVVVAPPSYAPAIDNVVTWYDQAVNVNAKHFNPILMARRPSFTQDIYPILKRAVMLQWVLKKEYRHHGSGGNFLGPARFNQLADNTDGAKQARQAVFSWLMKPHTPAPAVEQYPAQPPNMPKLFSGLNPDNTSLAEYASLTEFQYAMMSKWANGDFDADWKGEPTSPTLDNIPLAEQPDALTRAALEGCIGAPFYPGIEGTYVIAQALTYEAPFRINRKLTPGHLTERMALPWQADFRDCGELWWPAQRPVEVNTNSGEIKSFSRGIKGYGDMVKWWTELGFVVKKGNEFVEDERRPINGEA